MNVVLDLDNTLISAKDNEEEAKMSKQTLGLLKRELDWNDMENEFKVFARPHLQTFLTWLFRNFNVMVWTAASASYAVNVISNFILNNDSRNLIFFLHADHCKKSYELYNTQKKLEMIKELAPLQDTIIIDDNDEVYQSQPENCIHIKPFDVSNGSCIHDDELMKVREKLDLIRLNRLLLDHK